MTGAGAATVEHETGRYAVELRSVNNRFLKTSVRSQGSVSAADRVVEEQLKGRIARGHVSGHVRFTPTASSAVASIDDEAFRASAARLAALAEAHGTGPVQVADVLRIPGVLGEVAADPDDAGRAALCEAVRAAVDELVASRRREGELMAAELGALLASIRAAVGEIGARAADVPTAYRERLTARLNDLLEGTDVRFEPDQLAREVALLADRSDVREEIARLEAHVQHAEEVLDAGGAVGRRLDFLVQEMNREANTIGAKAVDLGISHRVVDLKSDVERLREQVQNLE
jgi:uncharacterized protein (TIGR00255 family)